MYDSQGLQAELVAGNNISILGRTISANVAWGNITGTLSDQTDLNNALADKQDTIDSTHKLDASNISGLATVATSGSYNDLTDKPNIPTATSDLRNDGDGTNPFATTAELPTQTSDLTNDSGFITNTYHDSTKQDVLTAGSGINITNNIISAIGSSTNVYIFEFPIIESDWTDALFESIETACRNYNLIIGYYRPTNITPNTGYIYYGICTNRIEKNSFTFRFSSGGLSYHDYTIQKIGSGIYSLGQPDYADNYWQRKMTFGTGLSYNYQTHTLSLDLSNVDTEAF